MSMDAFMRWHEGTRSQPYNVVVPRNPMLGDPERSFMGSKSVELALHQRERLDRVHRDARTQAPKGAWRDE